MVRTFVYFPFIVGLFLAPGVQAAAKIAVDTDEPIEEGYQTYTLFLIPDEEWLSKEKDRELNDLFVDFIRFGDRICDDNLAVWFRKADGHQ